MLELVNKDFNKYIKESTGKDRVNKKQGMSGNIYENYMK